MSYKNLILFMLISIGIILTPSYASEVDFNIGKVTLNGFTFDNQQLETPLAFVDDTLYFPLTVASAKAIGFDLKPVASGGINLLPRSSFSSKDIFSNSVDMLPLEATVYAYGYPIISSKEILIINETLYIALQDTPALKHVLILDSMGNLKIETLGIYSTLPRIYSIYDFLDSDQLLRNQGNAATCWAYAANTLFEIAVAKDTGTYENFSESHMLENAPIPATYESGGHFGISSIYYLNHLGPMNLQNQNLYQLLSYEEINNNLIRTKNAIFNHGAVLSSLHLNDNDKSIYNSKSGAYFNPFPNKVRSHELVLVGWDDSYNRENFSTPPSRDGAFIAQNSFGNQWGKDGFLYISYDDVHILNEVYALSQYEVRKGPEKLYFHDKTGTTHFETFDNSQSSVGVNVFSTESSKEQLTSVSFKTAENPVDVEIYYGLLDQGLTLNTPILTKRIHNKGYQTLQLGGSITLPANSRFWIAVKFSGDSQFQVPIESPYPGIGYAITANKGESYIGDGKTFVDLTEIRDKANVSIRVTTRLLK